MIFLVNLGVNFLNVKNRYDHNVNPYSYTYLPTTWK